MMTALAIALLVANMLVWFHLAKHLWLTVRGADRHEIKRLLYAAFSSVYLLAGLVWITCCEFALLVMLRGAEMPSDATLLLSRSGTVVLAHIGALLWYWKKWYPVADAGNNH